MLKLVRFGMDTSAVSRATKPNHVFRVGREMWKSEENEKREKIDRIHAQRLLRKYPRLKWNNGEVCFYNCGGERGYFIYDVYEGFDYYLGIDGNNNNVHNMFSRMIGFYESNITYYTLNSDLDVTVIKFYMENESEPEPEPERKTAKEEEEISDV